METFALLRNCGYKIYYIGGYWHVKVPDCKNAFAFSTYKFFRKAIAHFTLKESEKHEHY